MKTKLTRREYSKVHDTGKSFLLAAPKGFGKTRILIQHAYSDKNAVIFDLEKTSMSPEAFTIEFIGKILFFDSKAALSDFERFQDIGFLKDLKLPKQSKDIIDKVQNELLKIKPDQNLLLELAFSFPEIYGQQTNKQLTIILDEFQELTQFNNFPQIKGFEKTLFSTINKQKTRYILSSSAVDLSKKLCNDQLDIVELAPFPAADIEDIAKEFKKKISQEDIDKIHVLSAGIPIIASYLVENYDPKQSLEDIFLTALVTKDSALFNYCSTLFRESLYRARGATLLKNILKVMCRNKPLKLTEIARKIFRPSPVTKALLERLIEVDLVSRQDNLYIFSSIPLKHWCRFMFSDVEFAKTPNKSQLNELKKISQLGKVDETKN